MTVPVFRVHHTDLEAFIQQVFGFEYDFMYAQGITGACGVDMVVDGALPSLAWQRRADELRGGKRDKDVRVILNVLCADGYIPAGKYTITTKAKPDLTESYRDLLRRTGDPQHPECVAFRASHAGDAVFAERADVLDGCFNEAA